MVADVFPRISGKVSPEILQLQFILQLCFSRYAVSRGNAMFKLSLKAFVILTLRGGLGEPSQ